LRRRGFLGTNGLSKRRLSHDPSRGENPVGLARLMRIAMCALGFSKKLAASPERTNGM